MTTLSHLTTAELLARLAKIEASGHKAKASMVGSPDSTISLRHGRWVSVSKAEVSLNVCRLAWKETRAEIFSRFIPS